jgi:hypothetical protein
MLIEEPLLLKGIIKHYLNYYEINRKNLISLCDAKKLPHYHFYVYFVIDKIIKSEAKSISSGND